MQGEGKSYTPTAPRVICKILIEFDKILKELIVVHKLVYKSASNLSVKYGIDYYVRRVPTDLVRHYKST